ncbi:hypothetical protein [Phenylobacterium montanum]|uniref:Uncharacterized protein n=1 Tax=Phenylobacterium montanum TaxID=2823693 RepID=A0A975G454_9CAUL|nr:hypothetical protein [Caulobacter sp. S6]QUD89681.1 hypothetical protein KCG34_07360 [Caulobacter sp. S6]
MKSISICTVAAALFAAGPALALPYTGTFATDASSVVQIILPGANGAPDQGGVMFKGVSKTTDSSGKNDSAPYTCISWLTPGQATATSGVCNGGNSAGDTWSALIVCAANPGADPTKPNQCWGALRGTGGALKGKTGQFSQFGTGAGGTTQGAWN